MTIAINSSFTAVVPAAYGGSTPVVDIRQNLASISTAVALADAGSIVVSLSGAPAGAVSYTATGLLHEIASAGIATSTPSTQTQAQQSLGQGILASLNNPQSSDGVYDGSGIFTPTSGISADFAAVLKTDPGLSSVAVSDAVTQGVVGTLVSTTA